MRKDPPMSLADRLSIVLALWEEHVLSDADVVAWADQRIAEAETSSYPEWLLALSLHGVVRCSKDPRLVLPQPRELSFTEHFAVRAATLDLGDTVQVDSFARWAARRAMGEDLSLPEVILSYTLEDLVGRERIDEARDLLRKDLPPMLPRLQERATPLMRA